MSTASAMPAVIDALVSILRAAIPDADISDGPFADGGEADLMIEVGVSAIDDTEGPAGEIDQGWAWLGHQQRDETGSVSLIASAWTGDDDTKAARDRVFAAARHVAEAIESDPSLGGACLYVTGMQSATLHQSLDEHGRRAWLDLTIGYRARP